MQRVIRIEDLIKPRSLWIFDIDDSNAVCSRRDIGVRACNVNVAGVRKRNFSVVYGYRVGEIGDVEDFQSIAIDNKRIAELHSDAMRLVEDRRADGCSDFRGQRILK